MLKTRVLSHFKTQAKVAEFLDISEAAVSQWGEIVPYHSACELERRTRRSLKVDHSLYGKMGRPIRPARIRATA